MIKICHSLHTRIQTHQILDLELKFETSLVHLQEPMVRSSRLPGLQSYSML